MKSHPGTAVANVLSIAGSDPSGGAGIQADLKTFSALGVYGMAALTALTAQNTQGVAGVSPVAPEFLAQQIDTLFADIRVDAVKIGMVGNADSVRRVGACLAHHQPAVIVLDPVMVAKSGHRLVDHQAVAALCSGLIPQASIITPNLPEAEVLLGLSTPIAEADMPAVAARLASLGCARVLLKGGHLAGAHSRDLLHGPNGDTWLDGARIATRNTHGTGCTLSSGIAALAPQAGSLDEAVCAAKVYLSACLQHADGLAVGQGHGPVHHFHSAWAGAPAQACLGRVAGLANGFVESSD